MKRKEAMLAGVKFYTTGKMCAKGHKAPRYTSTGSCSQCMQERYVEDRKDPQKVEERLEYARKYYVSRLDDEEWLERRRLSALRRYHENKNK